MKKKGTLILSSISEMEFTGFDNQVIWWNTKLSDKAGAMPQVAESLLASTRPWIQDSVPPEKK